MTMMLLVASLLLLLALVRNVPLLTPRWWQLGVLAALLQAPAYAWGWHDALFRVSYLLLCLVAWANRHHTGGRLLLTGMLLNAVPILLLGRMPISPAVLAWGHQDAALGQALPWSKDVVIANSPLLLLGDSLPIMLPGLAAAWSIGDLVLCAGAARFIIAKHDTRNVDPASSVLSTSTSG